MKKSFFYVILAVIIAFSTFSGFMPLPGVLYFFCIGIFLVILFTGKSKLKLNSRLLLFFLMVCVISIIINNPPSYFKSWSRLFLLFVVMIAFSPLMASREASDNRKRLFSSLLDVITLFSVSSFFAKFLGINYFGVEGYYTDNPAGGFSGFVYNSILLGILSAIAVIRSVVEFFCSKTKRSKFKWGFVAFCCFGSVLFSASRGATAGALLGVLTSFYQFSRLRKKSFTKYLLALLILLIPLSPVLLAFASPVIQKNQTNIESGSSFASREFKYMARMTEIQDHFFTGIGFAAVDPSLDEVNTDSGQIEPGTSWLAVFSMTGVFGFLLLLLQFVSSYRSAMFKIPDEYMSCILCGMLVFFFINLMVEGYLLFGGSVLSGLFWLVLGVVQACSSPVPLRAKK